MAAFRHAYRGKRPRGQVRKAHLEPPAPKWFAG
jgi:hypothetical protein